MSSLTCFCSADSSSLAASLPGAGRAIRAGAIDFFRTSPASRAMPRSRHSRRLYSRDDRLFPRQSKGVFEFQSRLYAARATFASQFTFRR